MNLENFKKDYLKIITESTDEDLKNYIRSVVKDTLAEGVKSTNYNVSEKHTISAGTYPLILKAVNTLSGKNKLSLKMQKTESDLDKMENALRKNSQDETVLKQLSSYLSRLAEANDGGPFAPTYPGEIPLTLAALGIVTGYDPEEVNILDMIGSSKGFMDFNLDEIEAALGALKGKISKEKYNDFIDGDEDDQDQILFDYKSKIDNLAKASEFLNWAVNT